MENNQLIERYVYDVIRRLPDSDQEDVRRELTSSIYDMLPGSSSETTVIDETQVVSVLQQMGTPAALAEKYRQHPRSLISPAFYDSYIRALKRVLPLVGIIVMGIAMVVEAMLTTATQASTIVRSILAAGISSGVEGAIQGFFWITIGFVIADRVYSKRRDEKAWSVNNLPKLPREGLRPISVFETVIELVLSIVFTTIFIRACSTSVREFNLVSIGGENIVGLFNVEFLTACVYVSLQMLALTVVTCATKLAVRVWNPITCAVDIASNLIQLAMTIWLLRRPDMFSETYNSIVRIIADNLTDSGVNAGAFMRWLAVGDRANLMIITTISIVSLAVMIECAAALYNTLRPSALKQARLTKS